MALLLLYLLQTIIPASLGGVTLPFANLVGTVTPIKPKPLSCYKPEELPTIKSLEWDGEDIMPTLFSLAAEGSVYREFSSPLVLTSSSRPLPAPTINKLSISDVKIPDSCKESLPPSIKKILQLSNTPVVQKNPDVSIPRSSFPFKYNDLSSNRFDNLRIPKLYESREFIRLSSQPDLRSTSTVSNEALLRSPTLASANNLSLLDTLKPNVCFPCKLPLPTIQSLPIVPLDRKPFDSLVPAANYYQSVSSSPTVYSPPGSRAPNIYSSPLVSTLDPSTSRSIEPTWSQSLSSPIPLNPFSTRNVSPISSWNPLTYPLHYRSMYLPKVRTPSRLNLRNNRPSPYIQNRNLNALNLPKSQNILSSTPVIPTSNLDYTSSNPISEIPWASQMLPVIQQTTEYVLPNVNPIKITERPKCFDTVHLTPKSVTDIFNTGCPTSVACESNQQKNCGKAIFDSLTPLCKPMASDTTSTRLRDLLSSIIPEITGCKAPCPSVPSVSSVRTSALPLSSTSTSRYEDKPSYFEPTSLKVDDPPCMSNFDISKDYDFNIPDMFPIVDAFVDSIGFSKCNNIPEICTASIIPDYSSCQMSITPIPPSHIATVSPDKDSLCRITPTPVTPITSYVNVSPTSPKSISSAKMVSSINDIVSNITKNILSPYITHLKTAAKSVGKNPNKSPQLSLNNVEFKPQPIPIQAPLPPVNLSNSKLILSSFCPPNSKGSTFTDSPRMIQLEDPFFLKPPSDSSNSQPFVSASSINTLLPSVSLINYSSPPVCPSQLPSPILPSYPVISSPFCMESPILKLSSNKSKKKSDRVMEFMLLAELLNGDDNYEWDDLDTLLALLAIS